ncbi:MAG: hypothetical protein AB7H88_16175 [Vicinamibacterales bacterium]
MSTVTDDIGAALFAPDDFERAWHGGEDGEPGLCVDPGNTWLTVVRNAPNDIQDRSVNLWLDGERWEPIRYGRELTREIRPGVHTLKAHNTLVGHSFEFEARPGEHVRLRCVNQLGGGGMLLMLFIGVAMLRVRIEREA